MPAKRDYYDVLGVTRSASAAEIKAAYRKRAQEYHPDVNKDPGAADKFNEVQEAYQVLSDDGKRSAYDRFGHAGVGAGASGGPRPQGTYTWSNVGGDSSAGGGFGGGNPFGGMGGDADGVDVGSIFEQMFAGRANPAGGGRGGAGARGRARSNRARDINMALEVDFTTAVTGGSTSVRVDRGGRTETVDVRIPKGVDEGTKLRVRSKGELSQFTGSPDGDLILTVKLRPHDLFTRDGLDLFIDVPVTIAEATLGVELSVPIIKKNTAKNKITGKSSASSVEITIPGGTDSGKKMRLRGLGVATEDGKAGDLYAVIKIVPPKSLSEQDKALLEEIGRRLDSPRTGRGWV